MGFYDDFRTRMQCSKSPSEKLQDEIGEGIKDEFYNQPNAYTIYKNFIPSTEYDVIINKGNKDSQIDGYKWILSYPYDTPVLDSGDYIHWTYGSEDSVWLITSIDKQYYYNVGGRIQECTIELNWKNSIGETVTYPATNKILSESTHGDKVQENLDLPNGDILLLVRKDSNTDFLYEGQRFIINGAGYLLTLIENIKYANIYTLYLKYDGINKDNDDLINDIADNDLPDWTY